VKRLLVILLLLTPLSVVAERITVGSKNFNENYLLAEMISQLLEAEGHQVDRKFGLGGTLVCYEALVNGEIDVYVEYTGTIEQAILKGSDLHPTIDSLNRQLPESVQSLGSIGFNNTYAIAMKASQARELGLGAISELPQHENLNLAFSLEFLNREDGWPGLANRYNLKHQPTGIDHGLAYQAINDGKVDITDAYSTDGDLERYGLTVLADDREYFPDYFAAPLVRTDLPEAVQSTINLLQGRIDDDLMRRLNGQVVIDGKSFAEVSADYLADLGLVESREVSSSLYAGILRNTLVHLKLTGIALLLGCLAGLPLGILAFRHARVSRVVVYVAGLLQTVPSIALLALMIPLFGIGELPAIIALFLYSILPILRNTITALITIDPLLKRVAEAIGLTRAQQLRYVLVPMALPNILAGIKTAAIISIGTATLAAFIGAGGLGEPIVTGLALNDTRLILQGAIPAAILAIIVELLFELLEKMIVKPHMLAGQLPE
jgi:osmoprotectant transport system permease protein